MSLLLATPAVAFWLWLVIVPVRVAILCPVECKCDLGGYLVRCNRKSLTSVPLINLTDVLVLNLSNNNITLLQKNIFVSITELKILYIDFCELRTIELGAFNGLTKLTQLSMNDNQLSDILPGTFENTISLENLDLYDNKIKHLNSSMFGGLGAFTGLTNLKSLFIVRNDISEIRPGTFEDMSNLVYLNLSYNRFEHLDSAVSSGL